MQLLQYMLDPLRPGEIQAGHLLQARKRLFPRAVEGHGLAWWGAASPLGVKTRAGGISTVSGVTSITKRSAFMRLSTRLLATTLACAAGGSALAAPFFISYSGVIANSTLPEIHSGQAWGVADIKCAIWRMNNAGDVVYAQDLTVAQMVVSNDISSTNAPGALTGTFSSLVSQATALPPMRSLHRA